MRPDQGESSTMLDVAVMSVVYGAGEACAPWADAIDVAWQRLPESARGTLQVLALDNGSREDAEQVRSHAPWVRVVELSENRGMAAGFNAGLSLLTGEPLVILLNPDAQLAEDFFEALGRIKWDDDLGVVGPRIIGSDGQVEQSARRFPTLSTGLFGRTSMLTKLFPGSAPVKRQLLAGAEPQDVDWVSGACMIAPRARFKSIGPLDERYFLYWEDTDWCRRSWDRGLRVRYEPRLVIRHNQGTSTGGSFAQKLRTTIIFHVSAFRYYRQHVSKSPVRRGAAGLALAGRCVLQLCLVGARRAMARRAPSDSFLQRSRA